MQLENSIIIYYKMNSKYRGMLIIHSMLILGDISYSCSLILSKGSSILLVIILIKLMIS